MRELSAKLTEGETLDSQINRFAYTIKIAVYIQIANSHYRQIHRLQVFCAQRIFSGLLCCIMSATVKFDDQPCSCAIEIRNVITNCFLPLKAYRVVSQKIIP